MQPRLRSVILISAFAVASSLGRGATTDEVVKLTEFTVGAKADRGYLASETVSGSRVATAIKDLPYSVNVVTSEFLEDFGVLEGTTQAFAYTSSVAAIDLSGTGNSTVRGFSSQYMLRDGFFRLGRTDPMLIDRVEFIKGPNVGSIYGQSQPGGIINMITKRPTRTAHASLSVTEGAYQTSKVQVNASGPVPGLKNDGYFAGFSNFERNYEVKGANLRNRSFALGWEHRLAGGGNVYLLSSYLRNQAHTVMNGVPYNYDSGSKTYTGLAMNLASLNENGPNSETTREVADITASFEQRLSTVFSFRSAANVYHSHKYLFNAGSGTQYDYLKNTLARGTVAKNLINEDGGGFQADLVAHYKLFNGAADNKTLWTLDFSDYYRWDPTWNLNSNLAITNTATTQPPGAAGTYWFKNIFPGQPIDYSTPDYSPGTFSTLSNLKKNRSSIWGGLVRHQMTLLGDRLMLFGTLRYDYVRFNLRNFEGKGAAAQGSANAWSPSLGVNYKLGSVASAYFSRGVGFNANAQNQVATNTPAIQPNQRSWGYDYGIKFNLLDNRLFLTLGGYYTVMYHVPTTELLPNGTTTTNFSGSLLGRGGEMDLTWRVTENLTLLGGYGRTNTIYTYFGRDTGAVGFAPRRVPPTQGGLSAKYAFTGSLQGFSVNAGVSRVAAAPAEAPNTGDLFNSAGLYTGNDGRRYLKLPAYTRVDLAAHYQFKASGSYRQTVSVFLKNAGDSRFAEYLTSNSTASDRRGVYVTYKLGY
jgi:outer membrane receptor protein involved in Fe transport